MSSINTRRDHLKMLDPRFEMIENIRTHLTRIEFEIMDNEPRQSRICGLVESITAEAKGLI